MERGEAVSPTDFLLYRCLDLGNLKRESRDVFLKRRLYIRLDCDRVGILLSLLLFIKRSHRMERREAVSPTDFRL